MKSEMLKHMYSITILKTKSYNKLTRAAVERHVANLKAIDDEGLLELCGVFQGYPGVAGMYVVRTDVLDVAKAIFDREPLVAEGFATYELHKYIPANRENNYLL